MIGHPPKRKQSDPDIDGPNSEPLQALSAWALSPATHLVPVTTGTNNQSYLATSGAQSWILKCYRNTGLPTPIRFEHDLLRTLASASLPFAVPSPMRTISGQNTVAVSNGANVSHYALFHHVPGRAARFGSLEDTFRCGNSLAELDLALDAVRLDPATPVPATFGDRPSVHDAVPDPVFAIQAVFRDRSNAAVLAKLVSRTEERWQRSTSGWPAQLIHGDYYPTNTLMELDRVSGILDFEFAGTGHRAMAFAIGLGAFSTRNWDDGCAWPLVDSFAQGYLQRTPLSSEELAAVPMLLRFREATSFIHWLGHSMQGSSTENDIHARARRLLALDRWLEADQGKLANRLERIACQ